MLFCLDLRALENCRINSYLFIDQLNYFWLKIKSWVCRVASSCNGSWQTQCWISKSFTVSKCRFMCTALLAVAWHHAMVNLPKLEAFTAAFYFGTSVKGNFGSSEKQIGVPIEAPCRTGLWWTKQWTRHPSQHRTERAGAGESMGGELCVTAEVRGMRGSCSADRGADTVAVNRYLGVAGEE